MKMDALLANGLMDQVMDRIYNNGVRFGSKIPVCRMDHQGQYILGNGGGWTDSFWVGLLYLAYAHTRDPKYRLLADQYQPFFKERAENDPEVCAAKKYLPLDHDAGFIFLLSEVARYKLIGDDEAKGMALRAAETLAERFQERGQFIRAWDTWPHDRDEQFIYEKKGKMIIDSLMNIPLLGWAAAESGAERFKEIAVTHARTIRKYIIRPNYSTYHQFNFNPETGAPVKGVTGQGYHDESCWSRGQAWGLYGFALAYGYTKESVFLDTAVGLADYFVENLDTSFMLLWDFDAKGCSYRPWDSSAAAIAGSGLLEICRHLQDGERLDKFRLAADNILYHLVKLCGAFDINGYEPLLLHGCVGPAYQKGAEKNLINSFTDTPTVYGDYFFVEALIKLARPEIALFW